MYEKTFQLGSPKWVIIPLLGHEPQRVQKGGLTGIANIRPYFDRVLNKDKKITQVYLKVVLKLIIDIDECYLPQKVLLNIIGKEPLLFKILQPRDYDKKY